MNNKGYCTLVSILLAATCCVAQAPTLTQNHIMETTVKTAGITSVSQLAGLPVGTANRRISYFDGLGRPLQTVAWQAGPDGHDLVTTVTYDALGRPLKTYLPYRAGTVDGSFQAGAEAAALSYYQGSHAGVVQTAYPFGMPVYEASPLNRVLEQGSPGAAWQPGGTSGHTIKTVESTNVMNEVRLWAINAAANGAASTAFYLPGKLYKTVIRDENWTASHENTTEEFKDLEGRVVLKRTWKDNATSLSTYYVYDGSGNLRYVLPPAVNENGSPGYSGTTGFTEASPVFELFIYGYHYDALNRVVEKKVPGKGWEYLVYNRLDQVVLTQDAVQRGNSQWGFVKYDALGRAVVTGLVSSTQSRAAWQSAVEGQAVLWEARDTNNTNGSGTGYTFQAMPYSYAAIHTVNYYDDYGFYGNAFGGPSGAQASGVGTTGLLTGTRTNILGTGTMLLSVNYYDNEARIVQSKSQNHLGGTDVADNAYSFTGELTSSTRTHVANGITTTIANTYAYDHMGRKSSTTESINGQGSVVLSSLAYNEVGQLKQKGLHNNLQSTALSYNERGWLKASTSSEFNMQLAYQDGSYPQYNGNISGQRWGPSLGNLFTYRYDGLNRLTEGTSTGIAMSEALTYDPMGNIATMARDGGGTATYGYTGNRLNSISGGGLATAAYAYDANGNAVTDGRLGVSIAYNHLNLPVSVSKTGLSLAYTYDATGKKLRKVSSAGGTTDYVEGIQYVNGTIDFIQTEEGIARRNGTVYSYEYNLTDHLGNVRATFYQNPVSQQIEVLQRDDYYAFGLRKTGIPNSNTNRYLYNGKEIQDELGQYDYGARFYDPVIGRWNSVDPLAEQMRRHSPYNYAFNNPMRFIDPDGMGPTDWVRNKKGEIYWDKNANNQESTKKDEKYLGKALSFQFTSYIDAMSWDGPSPPGIDPAGVKLTSTINVTGNENSAGELTSISVGKHVEPGPTPVGTPRLTYPGLGPDQNKFDVSTTSSGVSVNFEQHASVSRVEEFGLNAMGYSIVNVAQKLDLNYSKGSGNLSVSAATDVFPSAKLTLNGQKIMQYDQPSFKATHTKTSDSYKPANWYKRL